MNNNNKYINKHKNNLNNYDKNMNNKNNKLKKVFNYKIYNNKK